MQWNKERFKQFVQDKGAYIGMAIVAIVVLGFIAWHNNKGGPEHQHAQYPETFFVTALDFGYIETNPAPGQAIAVSFSQPVDAATLKDFFILSPNLKGRFEGSNLGNSLAATDALFIPERPFESGVDYTVTIKAGLSSAIGSELQEDFTRILSLRFSADDYKILKNDRFSLLQSVSLYNPGSLKAQVGGNIKNPSIKIFKATDPESIIRDILTYTAPTNNYNDPGFKTDGSTLELLKTQGEVRHNTPVELPNEVGLYLVQALAGDNNTVRSQVWVSVNTMGVHFRQDDQKFLVAAQDLKSGEPIAGAELRTYEVRDEDRLTLLQRYQVSGLAQFSLVYPKKISIATLRRGSEIAFIPVSVQGSLAELNVSQDLTNAWQGFVYTDRPIYKTTDTIKFRGILRKDNDAVYQLPPAGTRISLFGAGEQADSQIPPTEVFLDETGAFYGEFQVNKLPAGFYNIYAEMTGNASIQGAQAWFELKDYTKPDFELQARIDKEEYVEGDTINVNLKGSNFNGQPFGRQKVTYTVYAQDFYETEKAVYNESFALNGWGGMCGGGGFDAFGTYYGEALAPAQELTLGDGGDLSVTFDTKKLDRNISQQVTFVVEKNDRNGNTITDAQTAIVHNGELNIFLRAFKNQAKNTTAPTALFSAESLTGEKLGNRQFDYKIEQVRYEFRDNQNQRIATPVTTGQTRTNAQGNGEFKLSGLDKVEPGFDNLEVSVQTKDSRGNLITGTQPMYFFSSTFQDERPVLLDITSTQLNLIPGNKAQLKIVAPEAIRVLLAFERGRVYDAQWLSLKAGENIYEFPVKPEYRPSITPTFSAFYNNRYYIEGLTFNVPAMDKLITITATTDKPEYTAGEVARITVKAVDSAGRPVQTSLSLGIIDKAIFALRKSTQLPLHSSFYYFRARRTNNSSSMTGISFGESAEQGGGGGGGNPFSARDIDVLYWNPNLRTNAAGELTVFVPVTGNTIWKGVIYGASNATDLGQTDFEFSSR